MSVTNLLDENSIKQEIVVFLRNNDIFSTTVRGVTTQTDTGTFTTASEHTVATTPTLLKNVRSVTIATNLLKFGVDYTVNYDTGKISFVTTKSGAYSIVYDVGATDKIFSDFPKVEMQISSYPRLAVGITSVRTDDNELNGYSNISELLISVYAYGVGTNNTDDYIKNVRQKFLENKNNFYHLRYVTISGSSPLINEPMRGDKIFTKVLDLLSPLNVEVIN